MKPDRDKASRKRTRDMSPDERLRFEQDVIQGGTEPVKGAVKGDAELPESPEDRVTKSGRTRRADIRAGGVTSPSPEVYRRRS